MSLGYPTIDLTDHPEHAKSAWENLRVRLAELAGYDLEANLAQIKMLEIGCGRAEFLRYALGRGVNIVGIDRNLFRGLEELPITQSDIAVQIPFDDEAFDLLYSCGVFDRIHGIDQERAFQEIQRVMKAGALFAIQDSTQPDFEIAKRHGLELTGGELGKYYGDYYSVLRKM